MDSYVLVQSVVEASCVTSKSAIATKGIMTEDDRKLETALFCV
jgi:hypothetical protein